MPEEINQPYVDNYLAHFGVRGMRWGKRGSGSGGSSDSQSTGGSSDSKSGSVFKKGLENKKQKVTTTDIKTARKTQAEAIDKMNVANVQMLVSTSSKGRAKAEKAMLKYEKEAFDSDNAKIANKTTKGEKILNTAAWTAYGAVTAGSIAILAKPRVSRY